MKDTIRIGTRESELALWQANKVKSLLEQQGYSAELVLIKSEGDINLTTPLYEIGVQGIFTKALDIALLHGQIDIAVHSMKDVPTQMAKGIVSAAVLPRATYTDILVPGATFGNGEATSLIATSSVRRKAQWLHKYPNDTITNLRGNVNTRLRKLAESNWTGAIFAAAGLERINLRPDNAIDLSWMLPAPAQGAIIVVCRDNNPFFLEACKSFHDELTASCVLAERVFLRTLMGGCSTPVGALAVIENQRIIFVGNVLSPNGIQKLEVHLSGEIEESYALGERAAKEIIDKGGDKILRSKDDF